uniref:RING-CH-type domain-containing protein n=1 Tax=Ditylenchus dipsaci TaxID=166011 RepID=A0A915DTA1_9BILA
MADIKVSKIDETRVDFANYRASSSTSLLSIMSENSTRSLCRICQSETGNKIHPCACSGTMGGIHENCLNQWVLHSKKETCEICKVVYAKSGNELLPLRQWNWPNITSRNLIEMLSMAGLTYSMIYIFSLFFERQVFERLYLDGLPIRECDLCRFLLLLVVTIFLVMTIIDVIGKIRHYFRKQCKIRFVNMYVKSADGLHKGSEQTR